MIDLTGKRTVSQIPPLTGRAAVGEIKLSLRSIVFCPSSFEGEGT